MYMSWEYGLKRWLIVNCNEVRRLIASVVLPDWFPINFRSLRVQEFFRFAETSATRVLRSSAIVCRKINGGNWRSSLPHSAYRCQGNQDGWTR